MEPRDCDGGLAMRCKVCGAECEGEPSRCVRCATVQHGGASGVNLDERWTTVPTIEEMRAAYTGYKVVKDDMGNNYCVVKREWGEKMADGYEYRPRPVVRVPIVDDDNHAYAVACHIAATLYGAGL